MLLKKFKKQTGQKHFYQPLVLVTKVSCPLQEWFSCMLYVLQECGITSGPIFVTPKRKAMFISKIDAYFIPALLAVQQKFSHIISATIDVLEEYSVYRLLR